MEKVLLEREGASYAHLNQATSVVEIVFHPREKKLSDLPRALERGAWQAEVNLARGQHSLETRVSLFERIPKISEAIFRGIVVTEKLPPTFPPYAKGG
ncbi:MAG: hypothetical protein PHI18_02895 [bacterium]|nr:hypothetical protein [bacterium]